MTTKKKSMKVMFGFVIVVITQLVNFCQTLIFTVHTTHSYLYDSWDMRQYVIILLIVANLVLIGLVGKLEISTAFPFIIAHLNHSHSSKNDDNVISSHGIMFENEEYCVGCTGTVVGLLLSSSILFGYVFLLPVPLRAGNPLIFWIIACICISVAYLRYFFQLTPLIRLLQHSLLPIGSALLIIATDLAFANTIAIILSFFSILILFWLRNTLSSMYHYHS